MTDSENERTELGLSARLRFIIGDEATRNFAKRVGVKDSTLRSVLKGTRPSIDFVIAIAEAANISLEWLATGAGRPYKAFRNDSPPSHINRALFDMIAETVERVHAELGVHLHAAGIAATVMDYYVSVVDLASANGDIEEYRSLIPWVEFHVRKEAKYHKQVQDEEAGG